MDLWSNLFWNIFTQRDAFTLPMEDLDEDLAKDIADLFYDSQSGYLYVLYDSGGVVGIFERDSHSNAWKYVSQFTTPFDGIEGIALRQVK